MSRRTRTLRVGAEPPDRPSSGIDPRSGDTVLFYVEGRVPSEVPARDLNGGDLDRIAYVRRFRATDGERPGELGEGELDALADELVAGGAFSRDLPRGNPGAPDDQSTATEPEPPAERPEV